MASFLRRPQTQDSTGGDDRDRTDALSQPRNAGRAPEGRSSTPPVPGFIAPAETREGAGLRQGTGANETARRGSDIAPRRPLEPTPRGNLQSRALTIGSQITMQGTITDCDVLVVEGTAEATLENSKSLEVTESGVFRGTITIDEATIAGVMEGELTVRERLKVRPTGRIRGTVKCSKLEVEFGGEIEGQIQVLRDGQGG